VPKPVQNRPPMQQYSFYCTTLLWKYWTLALPRGAYSEIGASHHELIDDAVAFAVYCMDDSDGHPKRNGTPLQFKQNLWNAMTAFGDLTRAVSETSERLDDLTRDLRIHELYMEQAVGISRKDKGREFKVKKSLAEHPSLKGYPQVKVGDIKQPLYSGTRLNRLRLAFAASGAQFLSSRSEAKVQLSKDTLDDLNPYLDIYKISVVQVILVVMRLIEQYMPLVGSYSKSFRADLMGRKLACKTFTLRVLDTLTHVEGIATGVVDLSSSTAERIAVLANGLRDGMSLPEFMAGEMAAREDPDTDFSEATEMTDAERLWALGKL